MWVERYIHKEYFDIMKPESQVPLACPDVYDFPLVSERFCREMIEILEYFGKWSDGTNLVKSIFNFFYKSFRIIA